MTDTAPAPLQPLAPDTPLTRANLGRALSELIATLPNVAIPGVSEKLSRGDLYSNDGVLTLTLKD